MDFEYKGIVYTDSEMEVLSRFRNRNIVKQDEPEEFYILKNSGLLQKDYGSRAEMDDINKTVTPRQTTKTTSFGDYILWRYEHPVLAVGSDFNEYVSDRRFEICLGIIFINVIAWGYLHSH
jgi:hypothetical protein